MSERTILKNFPFEFLRNIASGTFDIFDGKLKELNSVDVIVWNPSLQYFTLLQPNTQLLKTSDDEASQLFPTS